MCPLCEQIDASKALRSVGYGLKSGLEPYSTTTHIGHDWQANSCGSNPRLQLTLSEEGAKQPNLFGIYPALGTVWIGETQRLVLTHALDPQKNKLTRSMAHGASEVST